MPVKNTIIRTLVSVVATVFIAKLIYALFLVPRPMCALVCATSFHYPFIYDLFSTKACCEPISIHYALLEYFLVYILPFAIIYALSKRVIKQSASTTNILTRNVRLLITIGITAVWYGMLYVRATSTFGICTEEACDPFPIDLLPQCCQTVQEFLLELILIFSPGILLYLILWLFRKRD